MFCWSQYLDTNIQLAHRKLSVTPFCAGRHTIWLEWQVLDILDHAIHLDKSLTPHGSSTCTPLGDHPGLTTRVCWNTNALFTILRQQKHFHELPCGSWSQISAMPADYSVFTQPYLFLRWYFPTIISTVVLLLSMVILHSVFIMLLCSQGFGPIIPNFLR